MFQGADSLTTSSDVSPKLGVSYRVDDDMLLYTTLAKILSPDTSISQPYRLLNLRTGVKQKQGEWEASLFLDNALYVTASSFSFQSPDTDFILPPRTIGLRAMYSF